MASAASVARPCTCGESTTVGAATFHQQAPLRRDLDLVTGQSSPSGWVPLGRDQVLEDEILHRVQLAFSR